MDFISGDTMHFTTPTVVSPSFTTHSSNNLADVAARVVEEFRHQNGDAYDDILNLNNYDNYEFSPPTDEKGNYSTHPLKTKDQNEYDCSNHDHENDEDDDEEEFEFAVVCSDVNSCSISADEMFSQGHILPQIQYPLFDRSLLSDVDPNINVVNRTAEADCKASSLAVRLPLRKLFSEDRDFGSSSSSEADDLDGITPGTYCVWNPKPLPPSQPQPQPEPPETCKKSNSTGNSSRRWKFRHFRDILYRSNSDREETPILTVKPSIANQKMLNSEKVNTIEKTGKVAATVGDGASPEVTAEHDPTNTVRRQSYLPSTHDLVAAFTTGSRFNRNLLL